MSLLIKTQRKLTELSWDAGLNPTPLFEGLMKAV